ncbi:MAG: hypothetical protein AAF531_22295 [Actinomycetota bacterium]
MTVAPRALIVTRPTEYDELLGRHGSRQQVSFFLEQRDRSLDELDRRHAAQLTAVQAVSAAIPVDWRRATLTRDDLSRFLFGPEDVVLAVGQDGLVANVAKYLDGQPVIGVNPDPTRHPGVLVRHPPTKIGRLLPRLASGRVPTTPLAMVEVVTDRGDTLRALNEVYIGHPQHQSARYQIGVAGEWEHQSSSGVLVGTGTGSTGWCASVHRERSPAWPLPTMASNDLAWFVREAWPSPFTGTSLTEGLLSGRHLTIRCESDELVAFGDGIEADALTLAWGQAATVRLADVALHLW